MFHNLLRWGRQNSTDGRAGASFPGTCKFPGWNPAQEIILREKDTPDGEVLLLLLLRMYLFGPFMFKLIKL